MHLNRSIILLLKIHLVRKLYSEKSNLYQSVLQLLRSDDRWMFADPFIYNGMDITGSYPHVPSGLERLNLRG